MGLRGLVGVEPVTTFIGSGGLGWCGRVVREGDGDWMKKCVECGVEGGGPVGRPGETWLESVDGDVTELEIDGEDVGGE